MIQPTVEFCRTKYDSDIYNDPNYERGKYNPFDYLFVDNWPFIITYFANMEVKPSPKENLLNSLRIFIDCVKKESSRGYMMGFKAYEVWQKDLLDEAWYENSNNEQLARRLSVNQFCSLALLDARKSAYRYLSENKKLLLDKADSMEQIVKCFFDITEKAGQIHKMLDSKEVLYGAGARSFWTMEMRIIQAELLSHMLQAEQKAMQIAEKILFD